ncbi:serine hydrolase [Lysinibacillus sp. PLM2]|nr:serine hydrolase [Lysinibacillus sp. PLM2]
MIEKNFLNVSKFLKKQVEEKCIPGAVVGVTTAEKTIYKKAFGYGHYTKNIAMNNETIFDLASLTKVIATLPSILQLLDRGELDLDDSISIYFPPFEKHHRDITIKHLLTHTSGFQPEIKFYQKNISRNDSVTFISQIEDKRKAGEQVIYSDLNFLLLGSLVETLTGLSLAEYTKKFIYDPLDMQNTYFNPPKDRLNQIAATEFNETLKEYQWGEVHDENAFHFGGVSGHAGLFSNVEDLARFARMILNGGVYKGNQILSSQSVELSMKTYTKNLNLNRGLGWQLVDTSTFSGQFLQDGFGHTGFTGTSIWFSKERKFSIILLTNRVHFGRETDISRLRRVVHNLIALAMD